MDISVYNNSWLVPAKCGSRYLDEVFSIDGQVNHNNPTRKLDFVLDIDKKIAINESNLYQYTFSKNITHIVLRDPESHLYAALHTDLWGHLSDAIRELGLNRKNVKLMNKLYDYCDFGTNHWSPFFYQSVWWFLRFRPDVKIILLSELTEFVKNQTGKIIPHTPERWNFSSLDYTRNEIVDWIKMECPDIWKIIQYRFELDKIWWEMINNDNIKQIPLSVKDINFYWEKISLPSIKDLNSFKEIPLLPKVLKIKKRLI